MITLVSDNLKAFIVAADLTEEQRNVVLATLEQSALDAIRYVPKHPNALAEEEYFDKFHKGVNFSPIERAMMYGFYRMDIDKIFIKPKEPLPKWVGPPVGIPA